MTETQVPTPVLHVMSRVRTVFTTELQTFIGTYVTFTFTCIHLADAFIQNVHRSMIINNEIAPKLLQVAKT